MHSNSEEGAQLSLVEGLGSASEVNQREQKDTSQWCT